MEILDPASAAEAASTAASAPSPSPPATTQPSPLPSSLAFWIRTPCGRAKYQSLAQRRGPAARLRLAWFVLIAALRDLSQPLPVDQPSGEGGEPG
jgi:hypothetical protein